MHQRSKNTLSQDNQGPFLQCTKNNTALAKENTELKGLLTGLQEQVVELQSRIDSMSVSCSQDGHQVSTLGEDSLGS